MFNSRSFLRTNDKIEDTTDFENMTIFPLKQQQQLMQLLASMTRLASHRVSLEPFCMVYGSGIITEEFHTTRS